MIETAVIAPAAGLLGVVIGYVLQDLRDRRARDERREDRLWDYKRVAYEEFLAQARADLHAAIRYHRAYQGQSDLSGTELEHLYLLACKVDIYGEPTIAQEAHWLHSHTAGYLFGRRPGDEHGEREELEIGKILRRIMRMTTSVRADLGLPRE